MIDARMHPRESRWLHPEPDISAYPQPIPVRGSGPPSHRNGSDFTASFARSRTRANPKRVK